MSQENTLIINGLHNLIDYSTRENQKAHKGFQELHNAIIKHFFNASSVTIDKIEKTICLGVAVLSKGCNVTINYDDLNAFLKSCVRADAGNITFYKNLLHYYTLTEAVA
ncbi:hypothetical protein EAX61_07570 [Dokdonia sinensis]|uniref:Uncharacterized protein n=1 Tax=Dokdonia sinensis TaxID=2479847 RepID=A0A3M0G5R7_9FLAO|nr:hypothetical protein [Dokdonia sinensis]RMB59437.1 hypothetical protein EAX61_07570 [Dokdonia sinensis]